MMVSQPDRHNAACLSYTLYLELWQWDRDKGEPTPEFAHLERE